MIDIWLAEAVSNNAAWCDAIASSHDISTEWNDSIWLSKHPMPRLYPNLVTLKSGSVIDEKIDAIGPQLPFGWAIKDSFSELDLENNGFSLAFDAHWYCRVPTQSVSKKNRQHYRVATVNNQSELNRWVAAWGDGVGIFNSRLLENDSVELIYIERDGKIVSGLATNLSGDSVGISNAYGSPSEFLDCVVSVAERYPERGIVGYGSRAEVKSLSDIGFQEIGDLRVWIRNRISAVECLQTGSTA